MRPVLLLLCISATASILLIRARGVLIIAQELMIRRYPRRLKLLCMLGLGVYRRGSMLAIGCRQFHRRLPRPVLSVRLAHALQEQTPLSGAILKRVMVARMRLCTHTGARCCSFAHSSERSIGKWKTSSSPVQMQICVMRYSRRCAVHLHCFGGLLYDGIDTRDRLGPRTYNSLADAGMMSGGLHLQRKAGLMQRQGHTAEQNV
jgi:hypothetical protein